MIALAIFLYNDIENDNAILENGNTILEFFFTILYFQLDNFVCVNDNIIMF